MAREIVTLCDPCLAEDVRSTGRTIEIGIEGKSRTVELCETHELQLLKPLADILGRFGQRVTLTAPAGSRTSVPRPPRAAGPAAVDPGAPRLGKPPTGPRDLACIACEMTYSTPSGLAGHLVRIHGVSATATLSAAYGARCPLCGHEGSASGLGVHSGSAHHLAIARAFTAARDAGDPFGVVAERVAVLTNAR